MTEKQKKAFLKSEGWLRMSDDYYGWGDPEYDFSRRTTLENAFAIASRRKRQREWRRLKEAGFRRCNEGRYHFRSSAKCMTRQEALQTLEAQP